jgi:hypothetical protein
MSASPTPSLRQVPEFTFLNCHVVLILLIYFANRKNRKTSVPAEKTALELLQPFFHDKTKRARVHGLAKLGITPS